MKKQRTTIFLFCVFALLTASLTAAPTQNDVLKMVRNIELPGEKIDSLAVDMHIRLPGAPVHLFCRLRHQAPDDYSLQVFDGKDGTPLLVVCKQLALINDPFADQLSLIASAGITFDLVPAEKQYNAVFAFNTPIAGKINNQIRLNFKTMFSRLSDNIDIATDSENKIIFSGKTKEDSLCRAVFEPDTVFPLRSLSVFIEESNTEVIEFSRIECETAEPIPGFPLQKLQKLKLVNEPIQPDGFIDSIFAMNAMIKAVFARAAISQPAIREKVSEMLNIHGFDWQSISARDIKRSEALRELFPEGMP